MTTCLSRLSIQELSDYCAAMGEKPYTAKQMYAWIHQKNVMSFDEMTNLSKSFRQKLSERAYLTPISVTKKLKSADNTIKYLFKLDNDYIIESVLMSYSHGYAACVSTQVGCGMGCRFCASTVGGLQRNLIFDEIAAQVYYINRDENIRISNVVLMGSGEPLLNYDNTIAFIRSITDKNGQGLSERHITLSTCGIIPAIERLMTEDLDITLAVSLHAPNDTIRRRIMPKAANYGFSDLIRVCGTYANITKRRVTYEYALIKGLNDDMEHALELASKIRGTLSHVNLIPLNPVTEAGLERPSKETVKKFQETLTKAGIETTIRRELGSDISAACGQLRNCADN